MANFQTKYVLESDEVVGKSLIVSVDKKHLLAFDF